MGFLEENLGLVGAGAGYLVGGVPGAFVGGMVGGGMSTNYMNAEQASRQMEFQERMSGTAHRREMEDLEAAGLNPLLSARFSGASTPPGAAAHMVNPFSGIGTASDLMKVGLEKERNPSQIRLNESSAKRADAAAGLDAEQTRVAEATVKKIGLEGQYLDAQTRRIIYEVRHVLPTIAQLNEASAAEKEAVIRRIAAEVSKLIPSEVALNMASAREKEEAAQSHVVDYSLVKPASARNLDVLTIKNQAEYNQIVLRLQGVLLENKIDTTAWGGFWRYVGRISKSIFSFLGD